MKELDKNQKLIYNNIDLKKVVLLLVDMLTEKLYGSLTVFVTNGKITHSKQEKTIK